MNTLKNEKAKLIAEKAAAAGGRAYYVGGFVRDKILGIENKDIDIEVHGLTPDALLEILKEAGEPLAYGESFGIYALKGENIDIAMPRKEHAVGRGHKDFEISVDPFIGPMEAARRRDFTVNAMMEDVLTGEVIDFFGGREDLINGILRHVDERSFAEDPLRVLRCAQFASRFDFSVDPKTLQLCSSIDLSSLSKERVEGELKKALLKGRKPSVFFECLRKMNQLDVWFPELKALIGLRQDPVFHPEGDVWTHSMEVADRGSLYRDEVSDAYSFLLLCLVHDLGKITTTEEKNGRIHAYGHESEGLPVVERFMRRIIGDKGIIRYVLRMTELHMKPNVLACAKSPEKKTNKMFDDAPAPRDLIYFAMADKPVMAGSRPFTGDPEFLFKRYEIYEETMARPCVTGKDLIEAGLYPGKDFFEALSYAHKLRLAGIEKESALKQTLSYIRKRKKLQQ